MKEFLDEYKQLEKLCSEIYGQQHGVSCYIDDMEKTPSYTAGRIPGWGNDLATLKRVRHIRNNMVHDPNYSEDNYEWDAICFMKQFHQRILNSSDPLALRRQLTQNTVKAARKDSGIPVSTVQNNDPLQTGYQNIACKTSNTNLNKRKNADRGEKVLRHIAIGTVIFTIVVLWVLIKLYWN